VRIGIAGSWVEDPGLLSHTRLLPYIALLLAGPGPHILTSGNVSQNLKTKILENSLGGGMRRSQRTNFPTFRSFSGLDQENIIIKTEILQIHFVSFVENSPKNR
jgi:hypothetical protein